MLIIGGRNTFDTQRVCAETPNESGFEGFQKNALIAYKNKMYYMSSRCSCYLFLLYMFEYKSYSHVEALCSKYTDLMLEWGYPWNPAVKYASNSVFIVFP